MASLSQPKSKVDLSISKLFIGLCNGAHSSVIFTLASIPRVANQWLSLSKIYINLLLLLYFFSYM